MKKVIIALLVVASLFAFVSCKDEVTYDKWAKMERLDTSTEKGAVVAEAIDDILSGSSGTVLNPDNLISTEQIVTLKETADRKGTLSFLGTKGEEINNMSISFEGSYKFEGKTYTKREAVVRMYTSAPYVRFFENDGTTEITGTDSDYDFLLELFSLDGEDFVSGKSSLNYSTGEEYSLSVSTTATPSKQFTITGIEVVGSETGIFKVSGPENLLDADFYATDFDITIKYNEGPEASTTGVKTIKATYSVCESAAGYIGTVSFDGKTYGYCFL